MKKLSYLFLALLIVACTTDDNNNYDNSNDLQKEWLYTHTAIEATATSSTTLVIPFTEDIFAFTDRPNREFKYISGDEFASYWNDYDDENSFKLDPPNAVLTWLDADGGEEVEVVITDANFDGTNVIYTIENTTITANQSFEDVSLFVDANGSSNAVYVGLNNIVMASAGAVNNEQGNIGTVTYTVVNLTTLKFLIEQGDDVSKVVPSLVTDMSDLFKNNSTFNQNISTWDVSNVTNMSGMFYGAVTGSATAFNQPIGDWDVSNVTNMSGMFYGATAFNQPIGDWDVSSVTDMSAMFLSSALISDVNAFNQPIGNWNVSNVTDMGNMFSYARNFNQNISTWDVSNVTNMSNMFGAARDFNQNISTWSVDGVTSCGGFSINAPLTEANTPNFTNCDPN
jgi:surface protein